MYNKYINIQTHTMYSQNNENTISGNKHFFVILVKNVLVLTQYGLVKNST